MSYRQSSYDPDAYEQPGRPLKPYNWVQWSGVALGVVGAMLVTLDVLGRLGWIPQWIDDPSPGAFLLMVLGVILVNSRREPDTLVTEEQREKNKRTLFITAAICAAILGGALVIEYLGA